MCSHNIRDASQRVIFRTFFRSFKGLCTERNYLDTGYSATAVAENFEVN